MNEITKLKNLMIEREKDIPYSLKTEELIEEKEFFDNYHLEMIGYYPAIPSNPIRTESIEGFEDIEDYDNNEEEQI